MKSQSVGISQCCRQVGWYGLWLLGWLCLSGWLDPALAEDAQTVVPLLDDARQFVVAPMHWDKQDWWFAGGTVLAVVAAHQYDHQVRDHFLTPAQLAKPDAHSGRDWLPVVGAVGATMGLAWWSDDSRGRRESFAMIEATTFSLVTAELTKRLVRRERPVEGAAASKGQWFKSGGDSFPSAHVTAAFAVGSVMAESGNDDLRWLRRIVGYGLGVGTAYARVQGNAHWLSDVVAGAALGNATARFVMQRRYPDRYQDRYQEQRMAGQWLLTPDIQGVRLSYTVPLH